MKWAIAIVMASLVLLTQKTSSAFDLQQCPHGCELGDTNDKYWDFSGDALVGISLINSSYNARPDNTGLALFRYASHLDIDAIGKRLSFPIDVNMFTDRLQHGASILAPSELDLIGGVDSTWPFLNGELGVGIHIEQDRPVDRTGFTQTDSDVRLHYARSLSNIIPHLKNDLVDGDIKIHLTLGYDWFNPSNPARPDNTGSELFMYDGKVELSIWHNHLATALRTTFFTDRDLANPTQPTELDLTYEFIGRINNAIEAHVAYERDMPLDTKTLIQDFVYTTFVYNFDVKDHFDHDE
jgi:hypothetical protein